MKGIFVVPPSWPDGNRKILLAQLSTQRMGAPWPGYWGASERHPAKAGVAIQPQMMLEDVSHPESSLSCPNINPQSWDEARTWPRIARQGDAPGPNAPYSAPLCHEKAPKQRITQQSWEEKQ